jgi:hypothetical protein
MSKIQALKDFYFFEHKVDEAGDPDHFYIDQGTKNEKFFLVLSGNEVRESVSREIRAALIFIEPKYLSAFCDNSILDEDFFNSLGLAYNEGFLPMVNDLIYHLIQKSEGGFLEFVQVMIKNLGAAYFLGSFDNKEIRLQDPYFAYRID